MILSKETADRKLRRMALEVAERNYEKTELVLIGIKENGIFIAQKVAAYLKDVFKGEIILIDLWLDKKSPAEATLSREMNFDRKTILLIDDVANTGRTMLYALKPLLRQFPTEIQTLVLVERTHKLFPIGIDYVGLSLSTTLQEHIVVEVIDGQVMGAWLR